MLTIILKILSILGILLLVLLGVALLIILLVLFVPVTYRVRADRQEAVPEQMLPPPLIHIAAKADWLLGALRVRFGYPDPGTVTVKLLCFTLFDSGKEKAETPKRTKKRTKPEKRTKTEKRPETADKTRAEKRSEAEKAASPGGQTKAEEAVTAKTQSKRSEYREAESDSKKENTPKQSLLEKIRYTFQKIYAKIKEIWENFTYYREVLMCDDTRGLVNHALKRLGRILKSIRPRKLRADIRFGTGSPDTTGYAFGIYGMFCSWLGKQVVLTPDFERAVLVGELDAAGHITVFKLLWHGLILVTDRRIRALMDKLERTY
ncbi:MAG: hypothetical protein K2H41_06795 [Acetatifactor sp.]|nr:hypothetical protein [Acetatifactor sp.]